MKFVKIDKIHQGQFITRYDALYETKSGEKKVYELISRDPDIKTHEDLNSSKIDSVVLILRDENDERILLNKEYRMATGEWVYNFPAGLIDEGETIETAAERELREETGLHLDSIEYIWHESYSAIGFSNEKNACIEGRASGTIKPSDSELEEIEAAWYTKKELAELLKTCHFAARTQAYCVLWARS